MIALFDLDGSLADYESALARDLRKLQSPEETPMTGNLHDLERQEHIHARMQLIKSMPGWWLSLPRIEAGFDVVSAAADLGYEMNVLTKGPGSHSIAWKEKLEWCKAQPELHTANIHIVSNKGLVYGNVLYDDYPNYMAIWLEHRPRGLGIMPVTEYNKDFHHPNVIKYDGNISEIREALEKKLL